MSGSSPGLDLNAQTEQGSTLQEPFTCSQSCRRAGVELATSFSDPASHAAYKWDYWPHDDVRAECRFVGLTNLGATCYLASTIQQLYMIPEARQAVFTAKVGPARPLPGPGQAASYRLLLCCSMQRTSSTRPRSWSCRRCSPISW